MGFLVPGKQMGDIGSAVLIFRYSPDYILEPFSSAARATAREWRRRTSGTVPVAEGVGDVLIPGDSRPPIPVILGHPC